VIRRIVMSVAHHRSLRRRMAADISAFALALIQSGRAALVADE
jgi:hypothetical protein